MIRIWNSVSNEESAHIVVPEECMDYAYTLTGQMELGKLIMEQCFPQPTIWNCLLLIPRSSFPCRERPDTAGVLLILLFEVIQYEVIRTVLDECPTVLKISRRDTGF